MSDDSKFSSFETVSPIRDPRSTDQPSMPAVPIILFGSQGSDFLGGFDAIFVLSQRHAVLSAFLSLALGAIRDELRSVAIERRMMPCLATLSFSRISRRSSPSRI